MEGLNLVTQNDPKNPAAEAYRVIRTSVQFAQAGKELKTIAITSCTPNEGKSMTIANLAIVLTQAGKSVLIMDCDMRKDMEKNDKGPGLLAKIWRKVWKA